MHNLKVENSVLFGGQNWGLKPGTPPLSSERLLQRGKGGARLCKSFYNKEQVVGTSKDYWLLKKTRYLKLMNLALFYVWEDAGVWAHWNHSFDMHLNFLGPVSCIQDASWIPQGAQLGVASAAEGLMAGNIFHSQISPYLKLFNDFSFNEENQTSYPVLVHLHDFAPAGFLTVSCLIFLLVL